MHQSPRRPKHPPSHFELNEEGLRRARRRVSLMDHVEGNLLLALEGMKDKILFEEFEDEEDENRQILRYVKVALFELSKTCRGQTRERVLADLAFLAGEPGLKNTKAVDKTPIGEEELPAVVFPEARELELSEAKKEREAAIAETREMLGLDSKGSPLRLAE